MPLALAIEALDAPRGEEQDVGGDGSKCGEGDKRVEDTGVGEGAENGAGEGGEALDILIITQVLLSCTTYWCTAHHRVELCFI